MDISARFNSCKGIIYALIFSILVTIQIFLTKALLSNNHPSFLTFVRHIALLFAIPFVDWEKARGFTANDLHCYLLAGSLGILSSSLTVVSIVYVGVGDLVALEYGGGIIITSVIAYFTLGESITCTSLVLFAFDCVGLVLVGKPSFLFSEGATNIEYNREIGVMFAVLTSLFTSLWIISFRALVARDVAVTTLITMVSGFEGTFISGVWTAFYSAWKIPETVTESVMYFLFAIVCFFQTLVALESLRDVDSKTFFIFNTLTVGFSYVLQITVFLETADIMRVSGVLTIVVCVGLYSWGRTHE